MNRRAFLGSLVALSALPSVALARYQRVPYGTVRIPGQVIWASDLTEEASFVDGVTTYYYSADAVYNLPAGEVRRIWADGREITCADLGQHAYFSSTYLQHDGSQKLCAWQMPLADFGNRIPSLDFEVEVPHGHAIQRAMGGAMWT